MKTKKALLIGAAVLAIGLAWTAGFVYYANANAPAQVAAAATPDPTLEPSPAPSTEPAQPDKRALLGEVMTKSATYLGISASDLKTQLQSGKSLADIANATPGKSRDGLVAALAGIGDPKMITKLIDRTITPH